MRRRVPLSRKIFFLVIFTFFAGSGFAQNEPEPITGKKAPDFHAVTYDDKYFTLYDLLYRGPVVLLFYPGGWEAASQSLLQSYQMKMDSFDALNTSIVVISVDNRDRIAEMAQLMKLTYYVVTDENLEASNAYKVTEKLPPMSPDEEARFAQYTVRQDRMVPKSAVFIIDAQGKIVFSGTSDKGSIRMGPAAALGILQSLSPGNSAEPAPEPQKKRRY